ncbi:MAG: hypothetical protein HY673_07175 [Chloroflexi bacterium]|nr:hypothetical protein [Chloroflexota bacterium]
MLIAEKTFAIEASRDTVWDLLGSAIFYSLPLEKIDLLSENAFNAELRQKVGPGCLTLFFQGQLVDNAPPESLGCLLTARSKWGIVRQRMRVTFALTAVEENRTEIICTTAAEGMGLIERLLLIGMLRGLAGETLARLQSRLEQLV